MSVTTEQLIAQAQEAADLTNVTDYVTDAQWVSWLNDGVRELHRFVTNKFKKTYYRVYDFTLAAGESQIALPAAFMRLLGLDIDAGTPRRRTIRPFNFGERNSYRQNNLRDLTSFANDRFYALVGSSILKIEAEEQAAGNYRLYYTPKPGVLALPVTREFALATSDTGNVPPVGVLAGSGSWSLTNAGFTDDIPEDETAILTLDMEAPNAGFSGDYPIVEIGLASEGYGTPAASSNNLASVAGLTPPLVGTGSYTYQPIGTTDELDDELDPYSEYVWLTAAIKSLVKEESFAQAKELKEQRNLIRVDLLEALETDSGGPATVIDTDDDNAGDW